MNIEYYNAIIAFAAVAAVVIAGLAIFYESRRSRFSLGVDLILRLDERFNNKDMREKRISAARSLLGQENIGADDVLDFFEMIGILVNRGAIDEKMAWHIFFPWLDQYWHSAKEYIRKERDKDPTIWEDLASVHGRLVAIEKRERACTNRDVAPSKESLRQFLEFESKLPLN